MQIFANTVRILATALLICTIAVRICATAFLICTIAVRILATAKKGSCCQMQQEPFSNYKFRKPDPLHPSAISVQNKPNTTLSPVSSVQDKPDPTLSPAGSAQSKPHHSYQSRLPLPKRLLSYSSE